MWRCSVASVTSFRCPVDFVPKFRVGTHLCETPFRESCETEIRGSAFPNRVGERGWRGVVSVAIRFRAGRSLTTIDAMIRLIQRKLIYRPLRGAVKLDPAAVPSGVVREVHVRAADGLMLHGWHAESQRVPDRGDRRPLVLFFPGNAGHRGCRLRDFELLTQIGADVMLVDYRGYAENKGRPTEELLAADARAVWQHAVDQLEVPPDQIVLLGGSLGGGVATRLAHELCEVGTSPAGLILRATFTSLADAGAALYPWLPVRRLLVERFPSIERISHVTCPLLVVHGARDRIVPIEQGRRLFAAALPQSASGVEKQFVELPDSDHNDIIHTGWDEMRAAFSAFLSVMTNENRRDIPKRRILVQEAHQREHADRDWQGHPLRF